MTDEIDPIKTLTTARDKLFEERRALSVAIALGYRRRRTDDPQTNEMRDAFIGIQNLIEAIGRAIEHEKQIEREQPEPVAHRLPEIVSSGISGFDDKQ